jgi:hypothetical protein
MQEDFYKYGIDWQGPVAPPTTNDIHVEIPETSCPIKVDQTEFLRNVSSQDITYNQAIDVYKETVTHVCLLINQSCPPI